MKEIFKSIVGSQAYGTSIPESDIDHKGVYMQSIDDLISFNYKPQIEKSKDEVHYEIRRFIELLQSANPTVLELLYSPEDCIITKSPEFDLLVQNRDKFLTKRCLMSFGGYAVAQIKKARGLDKKMNWEKDKITRKDVLDFCYVLTDNENSVGLKHWLESTCYDQFVKEKMRNGDYVFAGFYLPTKIYEKNIGLAKVNNAPDLYSMYAMNSGGGIVSEDSNDVQLRSIPKDAPFIAYLRFDKMGYSQSCKDYREYTEWLDNRNTQRYVDNIGHGQQIDSKNIMHCRRLLDVAMEIATEKTINVRRPNREYLLSIRRGEVNLDSIIEQAEIDIKKLDELYANSGLPDDCSKEFCNELLLKIRHLN